MKYRYVFKTGRDLNIFDVAEVNLDGQWHRVTDSTGRMFIINAAEVNYIEHKHTEVSK